MIGGGLYGGLGELDGEKGNLMRVQGARQRIRRPTRLVRETCRPSNCVCANDFPYMRQVGVGGAARIVLLMARPVLRLTTRLATASMTRVVVSEARLGLTARAPYCPVNSRLSCNVTSKSGSHATYTACHALAPSACSFSAHISRVPPNRPRLFSITTTGSTHRPTVIDLSPHISAFRYLDNTLRPR